MSTRRTLARDRRFPTLLDRLIGQPLQSASARREAFLIDLEWLLNARSERFGGTQNQPDLSPAPTDSPREKHRKESVGRSVLNFGIPDLCGRVVSLQDKEGLEDDVRLALRRFEPRLVPSTVAVDVRIDEDTGSVGFAIRGEVKSLDQVEDRLFLLVNVDLSTGRCSLDTDPSSPGEAAAASGG